MHPLRASGFFVLRTPVLAFDELLALGADEPDFAVVRERLVELARRDDVRDAVAAASPHFHDEVVRWSSADQPPDNRKLERALVRYISRMAGRPAPFGLFAGWSTGVVGDHACLALPARALERPRSRLDMGYLSRLVDALSVDPELRAGLTYRPNPSQYSIGGRVHYVEAYSRDDRRAHRIVAADGTPELLDTLRRARGGEGLAALAAALESDEVDGDEARAFVEELVDAQLLIPDIALSVTGSEPGSALTQRLAALPAGAPTAQVLDDVACELEAGDHAPAGGRAALVQRVAARLSELPAPVDPVRLVQVDLLRPTPDAALPEIVIAELTRGINALCKLARPSPEPQALRMFRERFTERYGARMVPLVEALDGEVGIGFDEDAAPERLGGMANDRLPWDARETLLLRIATEAARHEQREVDLDAGAVELPESTLTLPDAFAAMAVLAAESDAALGQGEFELRLLGLNGPSGARLLGRFCHADDELRGHVEGHLRAEEALQPGAIFAEVAHLPEARLGNILTRPHLREHEIVLLAGSTAAEEQRLLLDDLLVAVEGGAVVLRSRRHGRRVVPRVTTAHDVTTFGLAAYRFLGLLQVQGAAAWVGWDWGPFSSLPRLPRIRAGRVVLAPERWSLSIGQLGRMRSGSPADGFAAVQEWREANGVPRLVGLEQDESAFPVDLDNPAVVDALLAGIDDETGAVLSEWWPAPEKLAVHGPGGRYVHELIVPFTLDRPVAPAAPSHRSERRPARRTCPPGSDWLYLKVYTGPVTADRLLVDELAPLAQRAVAAGFADSWHYLRYGDPDFHVRVRLHGEPQTLASVVLPGLLEEADRMVAAGLAWRVVLDTYEREIERYGGTDAITLAESAFHTDSEAVVAGLALLPAGDEAARDRWCLAVASVAALLRSLGLDEQRMTAVVAGLRAAYGAEQRVDADRRRELARRLRAERPRLEPMVDAALSGANGSVTQPALAAILAPLAELAPVGMQLAELEREGRLEAGFEEIAASLAHMHVNRLLRADARAHELRIHDALERLLASRAARTREVVG
jgi:thiopeptide-type bacteriocin biosynthesis protein